eukprot:5090955-Alexandrium_andersonii.AAC.1
MAPVACREGQCALPVERTQTRAQATQGARAIQGARAEEELFQWTLQAVPRRPGVMEPEEDEPEDLPAPIRTR